MRAWALEDCGSTYKRNVKLCSRKAKHSALVVGLNGCYRGLEGTIPGDQHPRDATVSLGILTALGEWFSFQQAFPDTSS